MPRVAGLLAAEHTAFLGGCGPGNTNFFYLYFIHFASCGQIFLFIFYSFCKIIHRFEIYQIGFFYLYFIHFAKLYHRFEIYQI
jgi:hypothetical protein